jgi:methanogenic corrinoid protein MtbC1
MPAESLKARVTRIPDRLTEQELRALLQAMLDGLQATMAQLDADTGVAGTTYAANFATYIVD